MFPGSRSPFHTFGQGAECDCSVSVVIKLIADFFNWLGYVFVIYLTWLRRNSIYNPTDYPRLEFVTSLSTKTRDYRDPIEVKWNRLNRLKLRCVKNQKSITVHLFAPFNSRSRTILLLPCPIVTPSKKYRPNASLDAVKLGLLLKNNRRLGHVLLPINDSKPASTTSMALRTIRIIMLLLSARQLIRRPLVCVCPFNVQGVYETRRVGINLRSNRAKMGSNSFTGLKSVDRLGWPR